jgi:hypothetical protein
MGGASLAAAGAGFGLLYIPAGAGFVNNQVNLRLFDGGLALGTGFGSLTTLVSPPQLYQNPQLLAVTSGLFAVWSSAKLTSGTLHFAELQADASAICGPVSTSTHADDANVGRAVAVGDKRLVALYEDHATAAAKVTLARFDNQCNELGSVDVVGATVQPADSGLGSRVDIAAGERIAVVWDETAGTTGRVRGRIFGKNLCD